jgi:uncharacterized repeat protein (TIGR03803 family)
MPVLTGMAACLLMLAVVPLESQTFAVLYTFNGPKDGSFPSGGIALDAGGNLYGTARQGGTLECISQSSVDPGCGTVFRLDAAGNLRTLYRFEASGPSFPDAGLALVGGILYGMTTNGGDLQCGFTHGCGTVYKLGRPYTFSTVYSFGGKGDASRPPFPLVGDSSGNLYGVSTEGGLKSCGGLDCGTVFKIDASGAETVLHEFNGSDGYSPGGPLARDTAGNMYGTATQGGGINSNCGVGCGVIFKIDQTGSFAVLYHFSGGVNGYAPSGPLALDAAGNLYGTTFAGGSCGQFNGCGVVYELDSAGVFTVLYSFHGGTDGSGTQGVIRDESGNLYGTTYWGGSDNTGTAYKIDTSGAETVLHSFSGQSDGAYPNAYLVQDSAGNLYGTTSSGGHCYNIQGCGVAYKIVP